MTTVLIGRDAEVERLRTDLGTASGGGVVVVGEPGIGKTSLLAAVGPTLGAVHRGGGLRTAVDQPLIALSRAVGVDLASVDDPVGQVCDVVGDGVLVLDDLHWVDTTTAEVVGALAGRVRVLAAARPALPGSDIGPWSGGWPVGWTTLELGPLPIAAARRLAEQAAATGTSVDVAVQRSGGRPGPLLELTRTGTVGPALELDLRRWLGAMAPDLCSGMALLALAGEPVPADLLDDATVAALVAASLATLDASARVGGAYPLLAGMALEALDDGGRRRLHERIGHAAVPPALAARHLLAAGHHPEAAAAARRAVGEAPDAVARMEALDLLLDACGEQVGDDDRVAAAGARLAAGRPDRVLDVTDAVTDVALRSAGDLCAGRALRQLGEPLAAAQALEPVASTDPDVDLRVGAATELALLELWPGWDGARAAEVLARNAPSGVSTGGPIAALAEVVTTPAWRWTDAAAALEEPGPDAVALDGDLLRLACVLLTGDGARLDAALRSLADRVRGGPDGRWALAERAARGVVALHRRADASFAVDLLEPIVLSAPIGDLRASVVAHLAVALADLGRTADASALLSRAGDAAGVGDRALLQWASAEVEYLAARLGLAARAVERARALPGSLPSSPLVAVVAAWVALESGATVPGSDDDGVTVERVPAAAEEVAAVQAMGAGHHDAAAEGFARAATGWTETHHRAALRCRWAQGECLRRAGDVEPSRAVLQSVESEAAALGLLPLVSRARQSLRRSGQVVRRSGGASDGALSDGALSDGALSGREREVLQLIGEGLATTAIAQRLGVASSTVETQITSAMQKLGARTRVQAVALLRAKDDA